MTEISESVKEYYGSTLQSSDDLKTNACCAIDDMPTYIKKAIGKIHDDVVMRFYGCGLVAPSMLKGLRVLDLGCGTGRDVYILSQLVGQEGEVIGVDMTEEQLNVGQKYIDYHTEKFGYSIANVKFIKGNIEQLDQLGFEENSFDLIISNCVINLVEDKSKVLHDLYKLLKLGGEFYFSDVYSDRRVPKALTEDKVLWGECLSGALYWNDFLRFSINAGFTDPRVVTSNPITIDNAELEAKVGSLKFFSVTYRLFKINNLESDCEDYGQAVCYKGGIEHAEDVFILDDHHVFEKGRILPVCGNTYLMLEATRYKPYFDFYGTWDTHYGIYEGCGGNMPFQIQAGVSSADCC